MEQAMTDVKYPEMRSELISYLEAICRLGKPTIADHNPLEQALDIAIHFIYDDTALADDASSTIGWFLSNDNEAELSRKLVASIDCFLEVHGVDSTSFDRFSTKEWGELVRRSNALLESLTRTVAP